MKKNLAILISFLCILFFGFGVFGNDEKILQDKIKNKFTKRNIEIFVWREELAEEENIPPAFIFKDKNLKKLSNVKSNDDQAKKKIMTILGDTNFTENFINIFL